MKKSFLLLLLLGCLLVTPAEAQRKAGRNGAAFLEIGVGAREVGLGSAVSSLTRDANQIFWNPAGTALSNGQRVSAALSYADWIADLNFTSAAIGYNLGNAGTVTVGVQVLGVTDIPANRENGFTDPILQDLVTDLNTSDTYNYIALAVNASYARYIIEKLTLGGTFKVINESIDGVSANAIAFDFGSVYSVGFGGWQIAARLTNLGTQMSFIDSDTPLPLGFAIGTSFYPVNTASTRLMLAVDTVKPLDSQQLIFGGAELSFYDLLFLRGGYKLNYSNAEDDGTTLRPGIDTTIEGFSLGGGIQYEISGNAIAVDYAYTQMELLNNVHRFTLRIGL